MNKQEVRGAIVTGLWVRSVLPRNSSAFHERRLSRLLNGHDRD